MTKTPYEASEEATLDRCLGSLLGLAIGDAMGAPVEFMDPDSFDPVVGYRSGGPFNLPAGFWTDDTSMALCLAESLIQNEGRVVEKDNLSRYVNWLQYGHNSSTGKCFDIGNGTALSLDRFRNGDWKPYPPSSAGNGSLMRLVPVVIANFRKREVRVIDLCSQSSSTTHNLYASHLAGRFGGILLRAIHGRLRSEFHFPEIENSGGVIENSGYAPESLQSALYHFFSTNSFEDAILQAVNRGYDSDTVGAITGQLAGAYYGLSRIPEEWVSGLHDYERILDIGRKLYTVGLRQREE